VLADTPAARATSLIVGIGPPPSAMTRKAQQA
jgi:hypothetical protein